jgi:hypothetical protein
VAERLEASQEGLSFMELVSNLLSLYCNVAMETVRLRNFVGLHGVTFPKTLLPQAFSFQRAVVCSLRNDVEFRRPWDYVRYYLWSVNPVSVSNMVLNPRKKVL